MNAKTPTAAATLRCAIYTRKSSEEGLQQSFNSLHAQREACEAYIKSQAHEGWTCRADIYDDGGLSGGSMNRPGLVRLLADIQAGLIDVVVVYKVDRLTRSLSDFAKIVDTFDSAGASFVSITQSFNTTTSMGRLTLNVLLSFAQFEREVTGERIRDKIAASKAKGMWMGGSLPLGYDGGDHTLIINPIEAEQVRHIFQRYLKLRSVYTLREELEAQGYRSKSFISKSGRAMGGQVFNRGGLYHLLQNRHYVGDICHRDKTYPGNHTAIIDAKLFDAVQKTLAKNRVLRRQKPTRAASAALTAKLFDQAGRPYTPAFSYGRTGRRYGYYVLGDVQQGKRAPKTLEVPARLSAKSLDGAILSHLRRVSGCDEQGWEDLGPMLRRVEIRPKETRLTLDRAKLFGDDHPDLALQDLQGRLEPGERAVSERGQMGGVIVAIPGKLQFRGGKTWCSHTVAASNYDPVLIKALKSAHTLLASCRATPDAPSHDAIAPTEAYFQKIARLAFLAPDIQAAILEGRQPPTLTLARLMVEDIPLAWADQRAFVEMSGEGTA